MNYQLLGKNIKKFRVQKDLSQEALGEKVGCSNSHIGQLERGTGTASLEMVVNIANVLGVTVDQLLLDSLDYPELVYLREMERRIRKFPRSTKVLSCEMMQDLLEIIEKAQKQ